MPSPRDDSHKHVPFPRVRAFPCLSPMATKVHKPAPKATGLLKPPGKRAESRRELDTAPSEGAEGGAEEVAEVALVIDEARGAEATL